MAKKKINKVEETEVVEDTAPEVSEPVEATSEESIEKKKFRENMELYKVQNPAKYEAKEATLLEQLNQLK